MLRRYLFIALCFASIAFAANAPWDRPPEQWTQADVFRILRDSPWSPVKFSLESDYSQKRTDPVSGAVLDSPVQTRNAATVSGIMVSRAHPLPAVTVLWWSSRIIRLAQSKLLESRSGAAAREKIDTGEASDYVLAVEGDEPLRILRNAREDLRDTVFLELESGGTLDFRTVKFIDDTDAETLRTEFHFSRILNDLPAIDPETERVVFHCRATAKKEMTGRSNSLSFRVEFSPRSMKVRGRPDM